MLTWVKIDIHSSIFTFMNFRIVGLGPIYPIFNLHSVEFALQ